MTTVMPSDSPSFSLENTAYVRKLLKDFFQNDSMDFFIYIRGNKNQQISGLVTDPSFPLDWLKRGNPINVGYLASDKATQTFSYLWADRLSSNHFDLAHNVHGLHNGFSLVKRYKDYFEMFGFATTQPSLHNTSQYLSLGKDLENFADYFVKTAKDRIKHIAQHPLTLPPHLMLKNCTEICLENQREQYPVTGLFGETYLTSQELFCLQLFLKGKAYKEIGRTLSISPRTVEKYLTNIKNKVGYHPRDISFLHEVGGKLEVSVLKNGKMFL